jgi:co-chaperonin GroES (HSP10)
MTNKKPANGRIIVQRQSNEHTTQGGLIIADAFESTTQRTKILAVGQTKASYTPGHYAYIQKHAGIEIGHSTDELVISEEHILWTVEE